MAGLNWHLRRAYSLAESEQLTDLDFQEVPTGGVTVTETRARHGRIGFHKRQGRTHGWRTAVFP